jgi:RNA polymerase sigma factor (sigma-70 family)
MTQSAVQDAELLAEFCCTQSAQAFASIVHRYIDLVYATARRMVGDEHLAQDVTQATFLVLMKKARRVDAHNLAGWLVNATRLVAKEAIRAKLCREKHESRVAMKQATTVLDDQMGLDQIPPLLDEALSRLSEVDRTAVVLRFLQGKSFAQVAAATGTTEEAARKRVARAVEKLRIVFMARGMMASVGVLMLALAAQQASAAPPTLAAAVSALPSVGASVLGVQLAHAMVETAQWVKVKIALLLIGGILAAAIAGTLVAVVTDHGRKSVPPTNPPPPHRSLD